jgi:lysophospholipase L1-like esterase
MKFVKIGTAIFSIIVLAWMALGFYQDSIEQKQRSAEIKILNQQLINKEQVERDRIKSIKASLPQIACWGDSLTAGTGGNGVRYSDVLSKSLNLKVLNYGVGGESASQIAYRQGAETIYLTPVTIPSDVTPVEVSIVNKSGEDAKLLRQGDAGINPCIIGSVEGKLLYDAQSKKVYFTRLKSGNLVSFKENTQIFTDAMKNKSDNEILIIYSGTNNPDGTAISKVIEIQKKMIEYANTDNYVIVGLTSKYAVPDIENVNIALKKEYGNKFLDFRKYLLENGLNEAGLTATSQDLEDIKNGEIPTSLRSDKVHGNEYYYTMLGKQLKNKIIELKYLSDDQLEVLDVTK